MSFDPAFFQPFWLITGLLVCSLLCFNALRRAQWWRLRNTDDLNVFLYALLGVFSLWLMNTDVKFGQSLAGPSLHLLGATLLTLMFGWAFAILGMSLVIIVFSVIHAPSLTSLQTLPWLILLTAVLPVFISYALYRFVDRNLPNNFFIYIFLCAFFTAAIALGSTIFATSLVHYFSGEYSTQVLTNSYIPYGLILVFPEAFTTGMLISVFVVYRPQWISTFDDSRYLRNR